MPSAQIRLNEQRAAHRTNTENFKRRYPIRHAKLPAIHRWRPMDTRQHLGKTPDQPTQYQRTRSRTDTTQ